jgi:hypothetical protein
MAACFFGDGGSSSCDDDSLSRGAVEGAPADAVLPGDIMEAARSDAVAAVAALLPNDAALRRLPEIRARAAAELRDAASDLNLSLAAQRTEVRRRGAGEAPAAAAGARAGISQALEVLAMRSLTRSRSTPPQLQAALAAVTSAGESCAALRELSRRVDSLCEVRRKAKALFWRRFALTQPPQESGARGAPAAVLAQLAATHANAASVLRSVRALQRELPAAQARLRRRFETYDAASDDGDDLEDAYEELCRLDVQGITAQARACWMLFLTPSDTLRLCLQRALEASAAARSGGARAHTSSDAAMRRIVAELAALSELFRSLLLARMRQHAALAQRRPAALLRAARLAQAHGVAASLLRKRAGGGAAPGVVHSGAPLAPACAAAVLHAAQAAIEAALAPPQLRSSRRESDGSDGSTAASADDVASALARADAALEAGRVFADRAAGCFPPAWRLREQHAELVHDAVACHVTALASAPAQRSSDDLLRLLAWAARNTPRDDVTSRRHNAASDGSTLFGCEQGAALRDAIDTARRTYAGRAGDALRSWMRNIVAHDAASPPQQQAPSQQAPPGGESLPRGGGSGYFASAATVDVFRLVHEQARCAAEARCGSALCDDVAEQQLRVLAEYAASLAAAARSAASARSDGGELPSGALERLCGAANNASLAHRKAQEEFPLGGSADRSAAGGGLADRAAATTEAFAAAGRAALYRLAEIVFWDGAMLTLAMPCAMPC